MFGSPGTFFTDSELVSPRLKKFLTDSKHVWLKQKNFQRPRPCFLDRKIFYGPRTGFLHRRHFLRTQNLFPRSKKNFSGPRACFADQKKFLTDLELFLLKHETFLTIPELFFLGSKKFPTDPELASLTQ